MPDSIFRRGHSEPKWRPGALQPKSHIPELLRGWLLDEGSLTRLVIGNCPGPFRVRVLSQRWERPQPSERWALRMGPAGTAFVREVELHCSDRPWVFARTLIPASTLHGGAGRLAHLRDRPLGAVLFADPRVLRGELEVARLLPQHRLYKAAAQHLDNLPNALWGRRRLFFVEHRPLLVNEIFLPELPALK